jgi:hypothetical protein
MVAIHRFIHKILVSLWRRAALEPIGVEPIAADRSAALTRVPQKEHVLQRECVPQ